MQKSIFLFTDKNVSQEQVGGKGFSLIHMANGDFPVPKGMVLGVNFFDLWLKQLNDIPELKLNKDDPDELLKKKTEALKKEAEKLVLNPEQRHMLEYSLSALELPDDQLFAVRSSSPEEDMEGASFAGMYETYLGVTYDKMEDRIRDVFISSIDYRVVAYKKQKGFDFTRYSIAVVIMAQIASETAGVGFSINPITNCYDEIVINSNFGLGESVVSGDAVPDTFVVDKVKNEIINKKLGYKTVSIELDEKGGTKHVENDSSKKVTLSDEQILELASIIKKVESYYGMPMDTEWGLNKGVFYMLQARPITTYIPLHPDFQTKPGEQRKLYLDLTLIEQGIQKPLSVLGNDCFRILSNEMGKSAAGISIAEKPGDFLYSAGGRTYVNLSSEMILEGQKGTAKEYEGLDSYAAQIIRENDLSEYKGSITFGGVLKTAKGVFTGLFKSADTISSIIKGKRHPEKLRMHIDSEGSKLMIKLDELETEKIKFTEYVQKSLRAVSDFMVHVSIPSLVDAESAKKGIKELLNKEIKENEYIGLIDSIDRALPYNATVELNKRIYKLTNLMDKADLSDTENLIDKITNRDLSKEFLDEWDSFMKKFGFRGPREIDVKTAHYSENWNILIDQMQNYKDLSEEQSPESIFKYQSEARISAYNILKEKVSSRKKFDKLYNTMINLGGYREIHKYYLVYAIDKIRKRTIAIAGELENNDIIGNKDDVFYLHVDEIQKALYDNNAVIMDSIRENREYMNYADTVDNFPPVIDSRGKILRPLRKEAKPGEIMGDPVSDGKVKGKVVIVNYVGEKEINEGDILVAKAADPGWTPLFINAKGILLEVGGMLQHGSLIAREYGKPCIAGIENLTNMLNDGDIIEMDGASGIIRKIEILKC